MSKKRALTDDYVKNLRRPPKGGRYEIADPGARRLWLRVGRKNIVFVVIARLGGSSNITRLHLGTYGEGEMDLDAARAEAKRLNDLIDRGLDPREEDERVAVERATELRATFGRALEDYLAYIPGREHNRGAAQEADRLRSELLDPKRNPWIDTALAEIVVEDVSELIGKVRDRPARTAALNLFRNVKTFFTWAFAPDRRRAYHVETNPIDGLLAKTLLLRQRDRERFLTIDEVAAYLAAAARRRTPTARSSL